MAFAISTNQRNSSKELHGATHQPIEHKTLPLNLPVRALSGREQEILELLIEGHSNSEMAAALHLSPNTVKTHVRSLMNKFGVNHRTQIAVLAIRQGLV
ncbi:MAG: response regulator transcription factor [Cyanobacteria bacterium CRU_2_1]|nr:response regulator transcription factor [Cyanobacteria bacterium RU_5_0]NJR57989.1 response regulator transcription factor [Cyanobacteria bacterium CRU_2_1]